MATKTYITEYDALRRGFDLAVDKNDTTRWNLYRGMAENFANRNTVLYKQQSDDLEREESWGLLRTLIEDNSGGGGDFSVYFPPKGGHAKGGTDSMSFYFRVEAPAAAGSRLAGVPYTASGQLSKADLQEAVEKERRLWELEKKLEDMELAQSGKANIGQMALSHMVEDGTLSRVVEAMTPNIAGALVALLGKIFNVNTPAPATVSVSGYPPAADQEATEAGPDAEYYDNERVATFLNAIRPHFSSMEEMYSFLDRVAAFFVKNPSMSKSFFQ